jgi:ribosomal protein S18 acetylase RimI-like enzyme
MAVDPAAPIRIQRAALSDLDALLPLFEAYRRFYELEPRPADAREFLARRLTLGDAIILVARGPGTADDAVGFVQLFRSLSSLGLASIWILNDLFVRPDHRRRGVGRALMDACERLARETSSARVVLETSNDNFVAHMLYESLGYKVDDRMRHYTLEVKSSTRVA